MNSIKISGERLAKIRESQHLSQNEVAVRVGIQRETITKYERPGIRGVLPKHFRKLVEVLEVKPEDLLAESDKPRLTTAELRQEIEAIAEREGITLADLFRRWEQDRGTKTGGDIKGGSVQRTERAKPDLAKPTTPPQPESVADEGRKPTGRSKSPSVQNRP